MTESTSMCASTENKYFENTCCDADASTITADLSNDEDFSASENQNESAVEDEWKSTEHSYFVDNGSGSGSCSGKKTLAVALL